MSEHVLTNQICEFDGVVTFSPHAKKFIKIIWWFNYNYLSQQSSKQLGHATVFWRACGFMSRTSLPFLLSSNFRQTAKVSGCAGPEKHTHAQECAARPRLCQQCWRKSGAARHLTSGWHVRFTGSSYGGLPKTGGRGLGPCHGCLAWSLAWPGFWTTIPCCYH